jgi:histidyl-tRNA synthetase
LLNEYELIRIIDEIFSRLRVKIVVKINNRKILAGIAGYIGETGRLTDITVAIDKIEKIGLEAVNSELLEKGISAEAVKKLQPVLELKGSTGERLAGLEADLRGSETGLTGISELRTLFSYIGNGALSCRVEMDLTLARGLDYYTGAIIEVKSADVSFGSLCGGGRYDNLTGVFGLEGVSGVGVSFGADRIYDVMNQLGLFGSVESSSTRVLVLNFGDAEVSYALKIVEVLRNRGIKSELYPDPARIKKQMSYADSKRIPYIIMAGIDEIKNNELTIKNMSSGEQKKILLQDLSLFNFS